MNPTGSSIVLHFFSFTKLASPYPYHGSAHVGMTVFWNFCATHLETVSIQSTLAAHQIPWVPEEKEEEESMQKSCWNSVAAASGSRFL
jgi:hypothetical protein